MLAEVAAFHPASTIMFAGHDNHLHAIALSDCCNYLVRLSLEWRGYRQRRAQKTLVVLMDVGKCQIHGALRFSIYTVSTSSKATADLHMPSYDFS